LVAALTMLTAIGVLAVPADAAINGSISGTVIEDSTDAPLEGIAVEAYDEATDLRVRRTVTAADGSYTLGDLPAANYYVKFRDPCGCMQTEFYDNVYKASAATILPVAGDATTGIDGELAEYTVFGGIVTDSATAEPVGGVVVDIYDDDAGVRVTKRITDGSGAWFVTSLPPGNYRVRFTDPTDYYVREWYEGVQYLGKEYATVVPLAAGEVKFDVDATLDVSIVGSISGTVTDSETDEPLPGIRVLAYDSANVRYTAITDGEGNYTLSELPPGPYRINFRDTLNGEYLQKWYPNGPQSQAQPVIVPTDTDVTGIDISLVPVSTPI
jgi:uncharacterized surface anchored protein